MSSMEVATTIISQLGGRRFKMMTGANTFIALKSGVAFKIPGNMTRDRINMVRIHLDPSDTYTVEFLRTRGTSIKGIAKVSDVYCDTLRSVFTDRTGLLTSMRG